jgi:hypothetical protein
VLCQKHSWLKAMKDTRSHHLEVGGCRVAITIHKVDDDVWHTRVQIHFPAQRYKRTSTWEAFGSTEDGACWTRLISVLNGSQTERIRVQVRTFMTSQYVREARRLFGPQSHGDCASQT